MNDKIPSTRWLRIITPVLIACIISFMDRVNISFALPGGMEADLGITSQMAGVASGIFFIGYLFLQIPGGRIAVNGSGKRFIAWSLMAWAVVSIATGFVTHEYQLLVLRFILGVSEGGMLPVVLTMVSNWFPEKELGRANAFVMMFAPLGGMLTAPVSGAIIAALDWRWLFIIEGLLSVVVLAVWWFMISDRPEEARWLPEAERHYLVTTLAAERAAKLAEDAVSNAPVKDVFRNSGLMKLVILNFFYQTGDYGYTLWLPTILKGLTGGSMASVGFLAVLPFVATLAGIYVISLFSDRSGKRRLWVRFSLYSFAAALVASVVLREHVVAAYIALVICGFFLKSATSPFWSMPGRIASAEVAGSARGVINGLGNLGGFCGPYLVGVMIYLYGQNVAVCALAGSLLIAGTMTFLLPKRCDLEIGEPAVAVSKQPRNA
ncbi:sugar transporter [Raoultella ornithinolytica]|jgi:sugar phosphate permease|uniref:MFS transporter n=1 Tax=Raoultella ornithinolytica TaxID=54291 RepID=A0A1Y6GMQ2_RAOOR|nr:MULTISPECIES: MFS transporter [Raoultella]HDX8330740.1 MFS transporter [Raoultella ornithinolytica CD1_MRS_4]AGJ87682.1 major facilitator superfamily protein [Raoultella ornithinolytica B6]ALQ48556.1 Putative 2-ketogluconate transporter, ACS family-MFS superfamily [Raoultella ornithinolytica]ANZ04405.1 2-ketogluconate transporter [Raoultella ornithinolytica]AOO57584.1 2-ketogluconate transporter [Raoultella ornithinolytica]